MPTESKAAKRSADRTPPGNNLTSAGERRFDGKNSHNHTSQGLEPDTNTPHIPPPPRPAKKPRTRGPEQAAAELGIPNPTAPTDNVEPTGGQSMSSSGIQDRLAAELLQIFPGMSAKQLADIITRALVGMDVAQDPNVDSAAAQMVKQNIVETILQIPECQRQAVTKKAYWDKEEEWKASHTARNKDRHDDQYHRAALDVLRRQFKYVPVKYINGQLLTKGLYSIYLELSRKQRDPIGNHSSLRYKKLKCERKLLFASVPHNLTEVIDRELNAVERHVENEEAAVRKRKRNDENEEERRKRIKEEERRNEEEERRNDEEHIKAGNLKECHCCCSEVPANRTISCKDNEEHLFCFNCLRMNAKTQIGLMRYHMQCMDTSGCEAQFTRKHLEEALGPALIRKLDSLQQLDELDKAEIEGLESCPFCDFRAIYPPVEESRLFDCLNPECQISSCRLCKEKSHVPMTCAENRLEMGTSERHKVEEAMSEALIRRCPRCKVKIIKLDGCNSMRCTRCGCHMCYICKKDITREAYNHFRRGACFLYDDLSADKERVDQAEEATIDRLLANDKKLAREELQVNPVKYKPHNQRLSALAPPFHGAPAHGFNLAPPDPYHLHLQLNNFPDFNPNDFFMVGGDFLAPPNPHHANPAGGFEQNHFHEFGQVDPFFFLDQARLNMDRQRPLQQAPPVPAPVPAPPVRAPPVPAPHGQQFARLAQFAPVPGNGFYGPVLDPIPPPLMPGWQGVPPPPRTASAPRAPPAPPAPPFHPSFWRAGQL